jgi:hypothetical protein
VRFLWPAQRYDGLTMEAIAVAIVMTAAAGLAIALPLVTAYRAATTPNRSSDVERGEIVTFVEPAPVAPVPVDPAMRGQPQRLSRQVRTVERVLNDTGSATASTPTAPTSGTSDATSGASGSGPTSRAVGPIAAPVALTTQTGLTEEERDRRLRELATPLPFLPKLPPTAEERDSAARELDRRAVVARAEHRPLAIPLGGVSVPLPFGPSREQRRRDSITHADNLQRLARLAARARAKRDSLLGANIVAGTAKSRGNPRPDSTRPPRP